MFIRKLLVGFLVVLFLSGIALFGQQAPTTALPPLKNFQGKKFHIGDILSLHQYQQRYRFRAAYDGPYMYYYGSLFASQNPADDIGGIAWVEVRKYLVNSGLPVFDSLDMADLVFRGYYVTRGEKIDHKGWNVAGGYPGYYGNGRWGRIAQVVVPVLPVAIGGLQTYDQDREVELVLYLEVVDKATTQVVLVTEGVGATKVDEATFTNIFIYHGASLDFVTAEPLVADAVRAALKPSVVDRLVEINNAEIKQLEKKRRLGEQLDKIEDLRDDTEDVPVGEPPEQP